MNAKPIQVVALFLKVNREILLCKRRHEGLYSIPGGKVEINESLEKALCREIVEEIGLNVPINDLQHIGSLNIRKHNPVYDFHLFAYSLVIKPIIVLNEEHTNYLWSDPKKIQVSIMPRFNDALEIYHQFCNKATVIEN